MTRRKSPARHSSSDPRRSLMTCARCAAPCTCSPQEPQYDRAPACAREQQLVPQHVAAVARDARFFILSFSYFACLAGTHSVLAVPHQDPALPHACTRCRLLCHPAFMASPSTVAAAPIPPRTADGSMCIPLRKRYAEGSRGSLARFPQPVMADVHGDAGRRLPLAAAPKRCLWVRRCRTESS